MKRSGTRILTVLFLLVYLIGMLPLQSFAATGRRYDAAAAVKYAAAHWDDGVGVCDQFIKACLQAGGVEILAGGVDALKDALVDAGFGTARRLNICDDGAHALEKDNPGLGAGDVLFFYCEQCARSVHVTMVGGYNNKGYMYLYGHNPGWDQVDWIGRFAHTGDDGQMHRGCLYAIVVDMDETAYAHAHNFVSDQYEEAHPHKMYAQCSCSAKYYLGWNATVSYCTDCNPPKGDKPVLTATPADGAIALEWSTVYGALEYQVWRASKAGGAFFQLYSNLGTRMTNSSVQPGTLYHYKVIAVLEKDSLGNVTRSAESDVVTCSLSTTLSAPTVTGTLDGDGRSLLTWNAVKYADHYEIWRASAGSSFQKLADAAACTYTDPATPGTYRYKVRSVAGNGTTSAFSSEITIVVPVIKPAAPTLTAAVNGSAIKLQWNKVTNALEYQVWRASTEGGTFFKLNSVTGSSMTNSSVTPGTRYYYKLVAVFEKDAAGNPTVTTQSNVVDISIPVTLDAPNVTAALGTEYEVILTWSPVSTYTAGYRVWRSANGGAYELLEEVTGTTCTDLAAPGSYSYKIVAFCADGSESGFSAPVSITVPNLLPPAPTLTATVSGKAIQLSWNKLQKAVEYQIWRAGVEGTYFHIYTGTGSAMTNSSVTPGIPYTYKLVAVLDGGAKVTSETVTCGIPVTLSAPKLTATLDESNAAVLSWNAISYASNYTLTRTDKATGVTSTINVGNARSYTDAAESGTYTYQVQAASPDGTKSAFSTGVTLTVPKFQPQAPVASATVNGSSITVSWNKVNKALEYQVLRSTSETGTYHSIFTGTGSSMTNSSVVPGTRYYYQVVAVFEKDAAGNPTVTTTSNLVSCGVPATLAVPNATGYANDKREAALRWDAVQYADHYEIWRADSDIAPFEMIAQTNATSWQEAPNVGRYNYQIRAVSALGDVSPFSSWVTITIPPKAPGTPALYVALNDANQVVLTWTACEDAASYQIWRSTDGGEYELWASVGDLSFTDACAPGVYSYKVQAINADHVLGAFSNAPTITVPTPTIPTPTLSWSISNFGEITLTWTACENAQSYRLWRAVGSGAYTELASTKELTYVDADLQPGKYTYYLEAVGKYSSSTSETVTATIPPRITTQPKTTYTKLGGTAKVTVKAEGDGLTYTWYTKNAGASKFSKSSVTSTTYSVKMTDAVKNRQIYCVVKDAYGNTVQSSTVYLRMSASITTQPKTTYTKLNSTAKVTVKAAGDGLSYTWYIKDSGAKKFTKTSTTSATYSVKMTDAVKNRQVYCVVKDAYGNTVQSSTVYLRMAASITTQPKTTYTKLNGTAKVTAKASGDGLTYTWYIKNAGSSKFTKTSTTSATYSVKMTDKVKNRQVYCVVKDKYGNTVQTSTVYLRQAASITTQPKTTYTKLNGTAKVTVKASGDGLTYTWYVKDASAKKFTKVSTTSATYSVKMTSKVKNRQVYCVVKDKYSNEVKTSTVYLRLAASITTQPKTTYTKLNGTAKVTVKASGDGLTYTWYIKDSGAKKFTKTSTTSATYSVKMTDKVKNRQVYCVVKDKYGNEVKTSTVYLRMAASISKQPTSVTVAKGAKATVKLTAKGDGLTYKWYYKDAGSKTFKVASSFKSTSYSVTMSKSVKGRQVYCVITDKYGNSVKSNVVTLKMK